MTKPHEKQAVITVRISQKFRQFIRDKCKERKKSMNAVLVDTLVKEFGYKENPHRDQTNPAPSVKEKIFPHLFQVDGTCTYCGVKADAFNVYETCPVER